MPPVVRRARQDELRDVAAVLELAAGRNPTPEIIAAVAASCDAERTFVAVDGDARIVGATSSEPIMLTVPGAAVVPTAKIGFTGLLPTHRRLGLAGAFFHAQLADLRERGEPLAALTTTQSGVPAKHGFSPATQALALAFRPRTSSTAAGDDAVRLRSVTCDDARQTLQAVYDRHRLAQPGQVSRSDGFWAQWWQDPPLVRIGPGERFFVIAEAEGGCVGYLTYRLGPGSLREQPVQSLFVEDLVATGAARRALWRFCLGFTQAAEGQAWNVPVDDPVRWLPETTLTLDATALRHFLHLRLVDVPTALTVRRYATAGSVVIDVADPVLPENVGRYLLSVDGDVRGNGGDDDGAGGGEAVVESTDRDADVALTVAELAAAYLGAVGFRTLAAAGRVRYADARVLGLLDAMFHTERAPWTVTDW